jgi:D-alanyl-D-alanine carboxypeptidase
MRVVSGFLIVVSLFALIPSRTVGAEPAPPKSFDLAAVDAYVAGQVREKNYIGLSLAIVRDGKIVLAKGYGKSCLKPEQPVAVDTAFAIGSITKQFTSACIFLLAEEGKLSVNDPVAKYYPNLTRANDVTLYDLMSHVSGYPDYYPLDFVDRRMLKEIETDKLIHEYAGGKLDFEPRTRWSYSNTGFIILGQVVAKVSGEPFGTFLERRILKPLKMERAKFEPSADSPGLARGYTSFALGPPELAIPEAKGWIDAAGGIVATASDLALWDIALSSGKVLKPESYRLMTTPRALSTGKTADYGCGLLVGRKDGETIVSHTGGVSGFIANNAMMPRTHAAVVLLSNSDYVPTSALHGTIFALLLKDQAEHDAPNIPKVAGPAPKDAALDFFHQMQTGKLDRDQLGEEFSIYLTDERVKAAAERLKPLGEPKSVEIRSLSERGGMEVAGVRLTFPKATLGGLLYRSPDGKIQQMLFNKE